MTETRAVTRTTEAAVGRMKTMTRTTMTTMTTTGAEGGATAAVVGEAMDPARGTPAS